MKYFLCCKVLLPHSIVVPLSSSLPVIVGAVCWCSTDTELILLRCAFFLFIYFPFSPFLVHFFSGRHNNKTYGRLSYFYILGLYVVFVIIFFVTSSLYIDLCVCVPVRRDSFARCIFRLFSPLCYHLPTYASAHAFIVQIAQILICATRRRHLWNIKITRNRNEMIANKCRTGEEMPGNLMRIGFNEKRSYATSDIAS